MAPLVRLGLVAVGCLGRGEAGGQELGVVTGAPCAIDGVAALPTVGAPAGAPIGGRPEGAEGCFRGRSAAE